MTDKFCNTCEYYKGMYCKYPKGLKYPENFSYCSFYRNAITNNDVVYNYKECEVKI